MLPVGGYTERMHEPRRAARRRALVGVTALVVVVLVWRSPLPGRFAGDTRAERAVTGIGQRRTIRLNDGSRVDLGVASTLVHPARFTVTRREVTLSGEAFFTVAADSSRPFVVTAGNAGIETLRATFAVRAYPEGTSVRVVVAEGAARLRIASAADTGGTTVSDRQLARVSRAGAIVRQNDVDVDRFTAWRTGRIILAGVSLRETLIELERWQDLDLRIGDSVVANRRVTAEFTTLQTFTEILDEIALGIGATYQWEGRVVTFRRDR